MEIRAEFTVAGLRILAPILVLYAIVVAGACFAANASEAETGAASQPALAPVTNPGARIRFADPIHDFGKIQSGEVIKHSYVFTNTGNQLLMISAVRPSCGCTAAESWDKEVQPGKTGTIPVQFSSAGFGGSILKTVSVTCNDALQTNITLQLKGTAWKPIEVSPLYAVFSPGPDSFETESRTIKIVNKLEDTLTLSKPECTNSAFQAELKTVKEGKEFELRVSALAPFDPTNRLAQVTLKTSFSKVPVITVNCYLNVRPALVLTPIQIMLPTSPLTNAVTNVVTIRNNGTNSLVLSKPEVSVEGVGVELKESKPGREYSMILTFPEGFKSRPGQDMEARVSSNHPKHPVLKVSIFQFSIPTDDSTPVSSASEERNTGPQAKAATASLQQ